MRKTRKMVSLLCAVMMMFTMAVPAFASEAMCEPVTNPSDRLMIYNPNQIRTIEASITRGRDKPDEMFNLDGEDYFVNGIFDSSVYTSYYFYPNAEGKLGFIFTFIWETPRPFEDGFPNQRGVSVICCDLSDKGKEVSTANFDMELQSNGLYNPIIRTGYWNFYNLNPTHKYCLLFSKGDHGINAEVLGYIYTP